MKDLMKIEWTSRIKLYHIKVAGAVNRYLAEKKDALIVDCGGAWGVVAKLLVDSGYHNTISFDTNTAKIKKSYRIGLSPKQSKVASIDSIPIATRQADCIICMEVLEHLVDSIYYKALKEIERVLKSGGYLIITVPNGPDALYTPKHVRIVRLKELQSYFPNYEIVEQGKVYGREASLVTDTHRALFVVFRKK